LVPRSDTLIQFWLIQSGVQGLLDQSRCTCHWDILLVLNLWDLGLGFRDDWSGLRDRLGLGGDRNGLRNSDWSGIRGWCAVRGTHLPSVNNLI
jgi:hypothetical protein